MEITKHQNFLTLMRKKFQNLTQDLGKEAFQTKTTKMQELQSFRTQDTRETIQYLTTETVYK